MVVIDAIIAALSCSGVAGAATIVVSSDLKEAGKVGAGADTDSFNAFFAVGLDVLAARGRFDATVLVVGRGAGMGAAISTDASCGLLSSVDPSGSGAC